LTYYASYFTFSRRTAIGGLTRQPEKGVASVSAANVEVVRSVYENFAAGEYAKVLRALAPDVEWIESDFDWFPGHGTHRSPDAVAQHVFGAVAEAFDEFAVTPERFHDAGDVVVVEGRATGKTRRGAVLDAPAAWVWTVHDGKATRNMNYHDTAAWHAAFPG
jgi:ketosteroid isomerase-like protein